MSATSAACELGVATAEATPPIVVGGVCNPGSLGVSRYARSLAAALAREDVDYRLVRRGARSQLAHFHLANSSRALLLEHALGATPSVVTVHDVVPRTRALRPLYRRLLYPRLTQDARVVVVHSSFAADLLVREARARPSRLEVIPHPARRPACANRASARRALGWPEDELVAVLPGVVKAVKLVREAIAAISSTPGWRLALAGKLADDRAARAARVKGALVLADPGDADYERAIVAADCVLCLRGGSVGETNGPLLDAFGAARAVLATPTGSIPEVAGDAVAYCEGTVHSIAARLEELSSDDLRVELEHRAARRAGELTWERSASLHAGLFREVVDG